MSTSLKKENNNPLLIGLTGGIGSGKSTIAKIFQSLGVPVFNSDIEARNILNNDIEVIEEIKSVFGDVYKDGKLDAVKMSAIVFKDENALSQLNAIVHPKVKDCFDNWVIKNNDTTVLIKEAAILIESGAHKQMNKIVLVTAHEETRVKRVLQRDDTSEEKVLARMKAQLSDKEKMAYADFVINNDGTELVIPQVIEIVKAIKKP